MVLGSYLCCCSWPSQQSCELGKWALASPGPSEPRPPLLLPCPSLAWTTCHRWSFIQFILPHCSRRAHLLAKGTFFSFCLSSFAEIWIWLTKTWRCLHKQGIPRYYLTDLKLHLAVFLSKSVERCKEPLGRMNQNCSKSLLKRDTVSWKELETGHGSAQLCLYLLLLHLPAYFLCLPVHSSIALASLLLNLLSSCLFMPILVVRLYLPLLSMHESWLLLDCLWAFWEESKSKAEVQTDIQTSVETFVFSKCAQCANTSCMWSYLFLTTDLLVRWLFPSLPTFDKWGDWGSERWNALSDAIHLIGGRARVQTQVWLRRSLLSNSLHEDFLYWAWW